MRRSATSRTCPAVEVINTVAVHLLSAAAVKVGLADDPDAPARPRRGAQAHRRARRPRDGGRPDIGDQHARALRDGLRVLQLAFREASPIPDEIGKGPGEKWTDRSPVAPEDQPRDAVDRARRASRRASGDRPDRCPGGLQPREQRSNSSCSRPARTDSCTSSSGAGQPRVRVARRQLHGTQRRLPRRCSPGTRRAPRRSSSSGSHALAGRERPERGTPDARTRSATPGRCTISGVPSLRRRERDPGDLDRDRARERIPRPHARPPR